MKLLDEVQKRKINAGGPGSGRRPASEAGAEAYKQTAIAQAATAKAHAGAKDAETPDKKLERAAAKEHNKAVDLHKSAMVAYKYEGNPEKVSQHRAASEEHAGYAYTHTYG